MTTHAGIPQPPYPDDDFDKLIADALDADDQRWRDALTALDADPLPILDDDLMLPDGPDAS